MYIIAIPFIVVTFLLMAPLAIATTLVEPSGDWAHAISRVWSRMVLAVSLVRLKVEGMEKIPQGPVIFISNHASQFDIPILTLALPKQFRFVVKQELFRIPLFSTAMRRTGYIPIDRRGGKAALRSLLAAAERVKAGRSLVIFPEGTRSPDGRLRRFKPGAFILAKRTGAPVVPVAIIGSHRVLPKGSLRIRAGRKVVVRIGVPLSPEDYPDKEGLASAVWQAVASLLPQEQRPQEGPEVPPRP